ncbi:hypothetical protein VOLCADRAFT_99983 [Volvox carteri f. nagariensis]|uniref:Uncharacterized protein n=1 Tax=Volvox carteri f. nagariensis TaxID=3068 RepID=D8UJ51_VOLCA|nr:uncharacterized protein VOLCADRAFT_99983 [Volvox carteri f. nagariensis]EFJ40243.1 hypothetical protein VOLCADRAFT_99983 [Volvox carteri f. nagariensis]|eukprot:XP_002958683.1 hypothetical protein VOLCADRAFT_99983 [Volvox carteri f. nagariensis]
MYRCVAIRNRARSCADRVVDMYKEYPRELFGFENVKLQPGVLTFRTILRSRTSSSKRKAFFKEVSSLAVVDFADSLCSILTRLKPAPSVRAAAHTGQRDKPLKPFKRWY